MALCVLNLLSEGGLLLVLRSVVSDNCHIWYSGFTTSLVKPVNDLFIFCKSQ